MTLATKSLEKNYAPSLKGIILVAYARLCEKKLRMTGWKNSSWFWISLIFAAGLYLYAKV